jgi:hypothetical protein|tara:strand:+ start:395 stop:658 length:264 start_codon:yes stop_codon:yes gene_type:complete
MDKTLTFKEFQKTRVVSENLGKDIDDDLYDGTKGFIYCKHLFIYSPIGNTNDNEYVLVLGNADYCSQNLLILEHHLYKFAKAEGYSS